MCKPSISGAADGYYRLNPGGVCAEPQAGRMCEAHLVKFSRDTSGPSRALLGPAVPGAGEQLGGHTLCCSSTAPHSLVSLLL